MFRKMIMGNHRDQDIDYHAVEKRRGKTFIRIRSMVLTKYVFE